MNEEKGGITIPVFDCIFKNHNSIESFTRDFDVILYRTLPHLYVICVADISSGVKRIVAGLFIKTSYTHHDAEFVSAVTAAVTSSEKLNKFLGPKISFLPARLGVKGDEPLSEDEMLRILVAQYTKHAASGTA